ncbi:MAG: hypothetical protein QM817_07495 [Archangium sp.]
MGSWTAIYLCGEVPPVERLPIEGRIEVRTLGKWTEVAPVGFQDPEPLALALSAKTSADVISVQIQTAASVVGVTHLNQAKVVRRVEHVDGGWHRIEGTPQAWERKLFDEDARELALEGSEDSEGVEQIFERAELVQGSSIPYPDEFGTMCLALGVERADWVMLRNQPPTRVLMGAKRSFGPLLLLVATWACVIGAIAVGRGDWRALFGSLSAVLLVLTLGAGALRRARIGKWFL